MREANQGFWFVTPPQEITEGNLPLTNSKFQIPKSKKNSKLQNAMDLY